MVQQISTGQKMRQDQQLRLTLGTLPHTSLDTVLDWANLGVPYTADDECSEQTMYGYANEKVKQEREQ